MYNDTMRRTAINLATMSDVIGDLAERWGLRPGAGPGKGHSALIRLALRTVAAHPPDIPIPEEINTPWGVHGRSQNIYLEEADDEAALQIQEIYGLESHAAAIRAALYVLQQCGLGPVSTNLHLHDTEVNDDPETVRT
jgi:hypothetical protein